MTDLMTAPAIRRPGATPAYRFGFALTTAAGNMTRYLNLRKYADRDPEVECVWAPISHYIDPNPFRHLPGPLSTRMIVAEQSKPVLSELSRLDAVMFHAFEPYYLSVLRSFARRRPLLIWSQDNPPMFDADRHDQSHYRSHVRAGWRTRIRGHFDRICTRRTALFFPFSTWARDVMLDACGLPADRVHAIHTGLDLELWPHSPMPGGAGDRLQILFVGGDFDRKGGTLLLDVYGRQFADRADLHLVTKSPPADLPPNAHVYTDLGPNDPRLRDLYVRSDMFVLPTLADMSSWVALEAMATGRPVIISGSGGIPDLIDEGRTGFLITANDAEMLADRMAILADDPEMRRNMGIAGRERVERHFSAGTNVPRILNVIKAAVDQTRTSSA